MKSIISPKNQTVIPAKIRRQLNLKSGDRLFWQIAHLGSTFKLIAEKQPINWATHTRGLGKKLWETTDITSYIKQLRSEWQTQN